ncbi:hypothetical protein [Nannocystis pusilla]
MSEGTCGEELEVVRESGDPSTRRRRGGAAEIARYDRMSEGTCDEHRV